MVERGNLLRHLNFTGLDVLQFGSGTDGVSTLLAASARRLVCFDASAQRIEELRTQLADFKNWEAYFGSANTLSLAENFDVVVVLDSPTQDVQLDVLLAKAQSLLRPQGVLVLATANQMGLKYFGGSVEERTLRPFEGICGYASGEKKRSFSKRQLTSILESQGFETVKAYFPFPDHAKPQTVLTEKMLEASRDLSGDLASHANPGNTDSMPLYPYRLAVRSVAQSGLLGEMSNSLLMLAARGGTDIRDRMMARESGGEMAWHYSGSGRRAATCTAFRLIDGQILVDKQLCAEESIPEGDVRWVACPAERAAEGEKLLVTLLRHLYFERTEEFYAAFEQFLRWSLEKWKVGEAADGAKLDGKAFDAVVTNASRNESGFVLFDLEWQSDVSLDPSWFVLRNVLNLIADRDIQLAGLPTKTGAALYEKLCHSLGIKADMPAAVQREAAVQARLTRTSEGQIRALYARLHTSFPRMYPREAGLIQWSTTAAVHEVKRFVKDELKKYPAVRSLHGVAKNLREFLAGGEASITK